MTSRSLKTAMLVIYAFTCVACTTQPINAQAPSGVPKAIPLDEKSAARYAVVDVLEQTFTVYEGGKVVLTSACGTGRSFQKGDANYTPTGNFKIKYHDPDYVNRKGQPMPNAMCIVEEDGIFIHGTASKLWMKNPDGTLKGIPQSGGCIRLPKGVDEKVFNLLKDGDLVIIKEADPADVADKLGVAKFFFDQGDDNFPIMKILLPSPSAKDIAEAREAFIQKNLFILWASGPTRPKDHSKLYVGFPNMPEETWVPFKKFCSLILKPGEKLDID